MKLLGNGDLSKKLSITVHAASATAREKVEAAGGSLTLLREPKVRLPKRRPESTKPPKAEAEEPEADEADETGPEAEADEPAAEETDEAPAEGEES